jgi:D-alanyl-D-alanine carboxypeptidase-like protein
VIRSAAARLAPALAVAALVVGMLSAPAAAAADRSIAAEVGLATNGGFGRVRFVGRVTALPHALATDMRGTTWKPGCPVPLDGLRLLALSYWGFDARPHIGPLVVNATAANDIVWVFRQLFDARFAIHGLKLTREFRPKQEEHDTPGDPTAAFNCRPVVTPFGPSATTYSQHSYGLAIDINPIENPFVVDGFVRNRYARPYVDRSRQAVGMIHDGDVVVRSFAAIGWGWGGHWHSGQDYMHFSASGT